jgi:hypothetical protein
MNKSEAMAKWAADKARVAEMGVILPDALGYVADEYRHDYRLAMDAQPQLVTTPSGGIPSVLTTMVDPQVLEVIFAPTKAAEILGEVRKGDWSTRAIEFPIVEATGEASTYGDFEENGVSGFNMNFETRQNYIFETIKEVGDLEIDINNLAMINTVAQKDKAAAITLKNLENKVYFFGVGGLQNYGLLNDPGIAVNATLTPSVKAAGGNRWITAGNAINATANEIYNDIQSAYIQLVAQTGGNIDENSPLVLGLAPSVSIALKATNQYGITVTAMLKEAFPNLRVVTAVQYGALTAANPQGLSAGNLFQLIAPEMQGEKTGYCAFSEKMRQHGIVRALSSFKQKVTGGAWGSVIRLPAAFVQMLGL